MNEILYGSKLTNSEGLLDANHDSYAEFERHVQNVLDAYSKKSSKALGAARDTSIEPSKSIHAHARIYIYIHIYTHILAYAYFDHRTIIATTPEFRVVQSSRVSESNAQDPNTGIPTAVVSALRELPGVSPQNTNLTPQQALVRFRDGLHACLISNANCRSATRSHLEYEASSRDVRRSNRDCSILDIAVVGFEQETRESPSSRFPTGR